MVAVSNDRLQFLSSKPKKDYYRRLYQTVKHEYETRRVFPAPDDIFNAFTFTPLADVKAVILGQNPCHNDGQAHGPRFSVKLDVEVPPSLVNTYQELHDDLGYCIPSNGYLKKRTDRGVILLNIVLTVRAHQANSYHDAGWEEFTNTTIKIPNEQSRPMAFILWGGPAQPKKPMLNNPKYMTLEAPHPSPLSMPHGFFDSRPFSKTNAFLEEHGLTPTD